MPTVAIATHGNYSWFFDWAETGDALANTITCAYAFRAHKNSGAGVFSTSTPYTWRGFVNGVEDVESQTFDMRPVTDRNFVTGSLAIPADDWGEKTAVAVRLKQDAAIADAATFMPAFDNSISIDLATVLDNTIAITVGGVVKRAGVFLTVGGVVKRCLPYITVGGAVKELKAP